MEDRTPLTKTGERPKTSPRSPIAGYSLGIVAVGLAVLLRWLLDPVLGDTLPLVTLFGAVAATVWFAGYLPALIAAILGYASCNYLFMEPRGSLAFGEARNLIGLLAYLFTCSLIIGIGQAMRVAQDRAHERRELLQVTLRSIGDAVITTDVLGRITYMNGAAETLTGWTLQQARDQPLDAVFRILDEATRRPAANPGARALREGVVVGLANHTLLVRKDGTECPIDDSAAPIQDEQGRVSGCVLVFRDVTTQRKLEREQASQLLAARVLASIVESSDDAIISKSLDGVIQSWNAAAERLFGHTAEQAVGRPITLVIPPDRIGEEEHIIAALKAGNRIDHFETERVRLDGRRVPVSLTVSPIKDGTGQVVGASKIVRDFTKQRAAEAERKRLEDDLRRLAASLSEADRRKDEFLATLAHELRSPLAPLVNMLEVLKRAGDDREVLKAARETIERQLGQMVRLVDDLLDLNRISHNRLELRRNEVELSSVIEQAVEATRPLADRAGHELVVSLPADPQLLHADPARLAQVFGNLLSNSCKYTRPGGKISLTAERSGGDVVVSVQDTGTGIPQDKLDSIFEMFTQVDRSLERSQGGLGIGLTLARRLVEMHGGSIVARSAGQGLGSEFVVRLPVLASATLTPLGASKGAARPGSRSRRILIVDDNTDSAESLAMLLKITGNETHVAHDGIAAVEAIEQHRPELVLLDIGLPRLSGYDVCRQVRAQPWGGEILLIALTGWGQEEDRRKSREAGFDGHLVKPVDHTALQDLLLSFGRDRQGIPEESPDQGGVL